MEATKPRIASLGRRVNVDRWSAVVAQMNDDGMRAESLCADLLRRAGLRIVDRNWRCRLGEIDLIAEERGVLVFVEVRLRRNAFFGGPGESITAGKRHNLLAAAALYMASRPAAECRFDVLLLDGLDGARIEWIRDAFGE